MKLGWIDYSKDDKKKALDLLDSIYESGTLDELGLAPIRDGFGNLFFPGITTIQTKAKYFFIIPYAFVNYYPLLYFLGKSNNIWYAFSPIIVILYLIPCVIIFYLGLKRYASVGS